MSQLQYQLDFRRKLPPRAQEGMHQADLNADDRWKRQTDAAILAVARKYAEFTVDEVVAELESIPKHFETHNPSALGPRMKEVAEVLRYMRASENVRRSKRPASKGNFLRVWKSLVYEGKP